MEEFVAIQRELLKEEHQAELEECVALQKSLPLSEMQNRGICLRKLHIITLKTGLYGRTVAKLGLRGAPDRPLPSNSFSSGDIVDIHGKTTTSLGNPEIQGVVVTVKDTVIGIAMDGDGAQSKLDELYSNDVSLILVKTTNEVTHKRLIKGLDRLIHHTGPATRIIEICFNSDQPESTTIDDKLKYSNDNLNPSQKDAVMFSLAQRDLAIIHGPPGTGKTTTIAEVITQLVYRKQKVLACAPSNVAIDNILEKLSTITISRTNEKKHSMRIVRIGHPARILAPELRRLSLDAIIAKSDAAKIVQDVRKDIDNLHSRFRKRHNKSERAMMRKEKQILSKELREREVKAITQILSSADVVLATNVGAHRDGPVKHLPADHFDVTIIDECGQALESSCWIPILQAPKLILAGDHLQLPPTVKSHSAAAKGLSKSLLERMTDKHKDVVKMLDTQYRMNTDIMNWSSDELYEGKLKAHDSVKDHTLHQLAGVCETENTVLPLLLVDTAGCNMPELQTADRESIGNDGEAKIVAQHVESLIQAGVSPCNIAVISPYNMQVEMLRKLLKEKHSALEIRSVDGFQGREKEAVVISMVRSNDKGIVGFLSDNRRMNVAVTRARRHLAVVCDSDTVGRNKFLKTLLDYISENGEVRSGHEYTKLDYTVDASQFERVERKTQFDKRNSRTHDKKPDKKHEMTDVKLRFEKIIQEFVKNAKAGGPRSLELSKTLRGYERLAVHEICEGMAIHHKSSGKDDDRRLTIALDVQVEPTMGIDNGEDYSPTSQEPDILAVDTKLRSLLSSSDNFGQSHELKDGVKLDNNSNVFRDATSEDVPQIQSSTEPANVTTQNTENFANCICHICGQELPAANIALHKIHCERLQAMKQKLQAKPIVKTAQRKKKPHKSNRKKSNLHDKEETDEELLDNAIQANKSCSIAGCNKFISVLGRTCHYCKQLFCLEHNMPELHGCGNAAHIAARRQISRDHALYPGSGVRSKKLPAERHAILQRKFNHKLKEMEDIRKGSSKKK